MRVQTAVRIEASGIVSDADSCRGQTAPSAANHRTIAPSPSLISGRKLTADVQKSTGKNSAYEIHKCLRAQDRKCR